MKRLIGYSILMGILAFAIVFVLKALENHEWLQIAVAVVINLLLIGTSTYLVVRPQSSLALTAFIAAMAMGTAAIGIATASTILLYPGVDAVRYIANGFLLILAICGVVAVIAAIRVYLEATDLSLNKLVPLVLVECMIVQIPIFFFLL